MKSPPTAPRTEGATIAILRVALLGLYVFTTVGAGVELLLLEHTEDLWQWTPLVTMAASVAVLAWMLVLPGRASVRTFQAWMVLNVVSGLAGLYLHYRGNVEFELEMYPSLAGFALFWEAIKGATPTLAPGTMTALGLLGLLCTYRHPALACAARTATDNAGE